MVLNLSLTLILTPALVGAICGVLGSGLHVQLVVEKRQVERRVQRGEGAVRAPNIGELAHLVRGGTREIWGRYGGDMG